MAVFDAVNKRVKTRNVHWDKKSKEEATGLINAKYKLAGRALKNLDQFIFFIFTGTHPGACHKKLRVSVKQSEWLNKDPKRLNGVSHIDITKYEIMNSRQVGLKLIDGRNRFRCVAELPQEKFNQLQSKLLKMKSIRNPPSTEVSRLIAQGLEATPDIMRRLGI